MEDDIREIKVEEKKDTGINPLDYVTIPIKEYRKLIRKVERAKADKEIMEANNSMEKHLDQLWKVKLENNELRKNLDEAKAQIQELLGLKELEQVKLQEMQFEKGVVANEGN